MSEELSRQAFLKENQLFWNTIANCDYGRLSSYYHRYLERVYRFLVPENARVLEIGCGKGDLLAAVRPRRGVGIDFSEEMILQAEKRHPHLKFISAVAEDVDLEGPYDVIILSDLLNGVWDIQNLLSKISSACDDSTRIIINAYSRVWQPVLMFARRFKLATPSLSQSWLTVEDIKNLLALEGFETIKRTSELVLPLHIPGISYLANRYLAKLFPFRHLCLTSVVVAKSKHNVLREKEPKPTVSVIVAARNEEGHIEELLERTPSMGDHTEIIFVEGGSTDNTYAKIEQEIGKHPERKVSLYSQQGKGKGDAVRLGFSKAKGDVLMILDADMTVPPEDLPKFYDALVESGGEFVNGVRLVYPMEGEAMRFWNLVGNKFFSLAFSWLLGQPVKDTLCGTKVLTRENYKKIAQNRHYFGEFDPFGDFDLIFGAAKQNLKIVDLPVRYRNRKYGDTNISRWKHGVVLLRMVVFAANKIKFF